MGQNGQDNATRARMERRAERLDAIRLRFAINSHLDERGITTPDAIGAAVGLPGAEAVKLLQRSNWREGDVAALRQAATKLGLSETPSGRWVDAAAVLEDGHNQPMSRAQEDV